ncbi:MAG: cobalamin biosynthesis protein CobD [Rhodoferax sp.]|nr:cobalamin biosynthesis protein CobD [Rhodoferax sp.]
MILVAYLISDSFVLAGVAVCTVAALWMALWLDVRFGEPSVRWHPVVWMGNYLAWAGARIAPTDLKTPATEPDYKAFSLGVFAWMAGAAVVLMASWGVQWLSLQVLAQLPRALAAPWAGGAGLKALVLVLCGAATVTALMSWLLKTLLAWAMLRDEVLAVEAALAPSRGGSVAAGRERLSWLVSRDVSTLSETQVRESAIESLAENLSDSVVAPIFWFMLFGLPGAALYRFANTADAMWGYPGQYKGRHWAWAGKWAARADDVLSWLPSRLTGVWLAAVAGGLPWPMLRAQARCTPSPNSGWPMAAMALALGVRLEKPGVYTLNPTGRAAQAADTLRAAVYASKVVVALVFIAVPAIFIVVFWML